MGNAEGYNNLGNLACRPNIKKNGVSCIVELNDVV